MDDLVRTEHEENLRVMMCEIGKRMYTSGLCVANNGNISAKLSENRFLCTPTGVSKGFMQPESLCIVDRQGNVLDRGMGHGPSSEIKLHLGIYAARNDVNAVVHAHPNYATTFAVEGKGLEKHILAEAIEQFGTVPCASYAALSTSEVPESIKPYVNDYNAVLLQFHGAVTWGSSLLKAYMKMESLEFYARQLYQTRLLGIENELTAQNVEKLLEIKKELNIE